MNRIMKKGGLLITYTYYWETSISTKKFLAFNNPIYIFEKMGIENLLKIANKYNFKLYNKNIDLKCKD